MATSWVNPNNGPRPGGAPAALAQSPQAQPTFASIFGGQSPFQPSVTAGLNGQPVSFATPSAPNTNYVTPAAATALAKLFGANAVRQTAPSASPGSPAPSQPMYGLDFGRGDVQGADVAAVGLARGDRPEDIAARYAAGLNNTGWGGPAPAAAPMANDIFWDRSNPISTNPRQAWSAAPTGPGPTAPPQQPLNRTGPTTAGLDAYRQLLLQQMLGGQR